jgi:predicted molibdopterin-dependent oxidoreductase YjgC
VSTEVKVVSRTKLPTPRSVTLTIDGKSVTVPAGTTVLRAAIGSGIYIPHLCDYRDLAPFAGCRMCLIEVENARGIETSCTVQSRDGMVVHTDTPRLREHRLGVLEVLLSDHPDRCLNCPRMERCPPFVVCQRDDLVTDRCVTCPRNKQCELQRVVDFTGWRSQRFYNERRSTLPERSNPFIELYPDYCIFCARCTRVCDEVIGASAIDLARRGPTSSISVHFDHNLTESPCIFCGACAIVCPTGALMKADVTFGRIPEYGVPTTCAHCGVGCGQFLNVKGGRLISVSPDVDDKASSGYLCVRGQFAYDYAANRERLKAPRLGRGDEQLDTTWDEVLDTTAQRIADVVAKHGPDAVGIIGSGRITTEEAYLVQKLARAAVGTNNVDFQGGEQHHAPTIRALRRSLGIPAMTLPTADLEHSGSFLVVGSNTMETHPVLFFKIQRAVRKGARLILIDPRESTVARFASAWLRVKPGADVAAINGMLRAILDEKLQDQAFVDANVAGYAVLVTQVMEHTVEEYAADAEVPADELRKAAHLFATGGADSRYPIPDSWFGLFVTPGQQPTTRSSAIVYASGLVQQSDGEAGVQVLANLALTTGMLGKLGAGLCPLPDQTNSQGACDVGMRPDLLPGYVEVADAPSRDRFTALWGLDVPERPGRSFSEILEGATTGAIKALLIVGANPARSAPAGEKVAQALQKAEFVAVSDIFPHETSRNADVVFAAAATAEKDGTFTNVERRVQRVRSVVPPVGVSRPDWFILAELAKRIAARLGKPSSFDYSGPAEIFREIGRAIPSYAGISYAKIDEGGVQWPCPTPDHEGTPYLFEFGFGDRKATVTPTRYVAPTPDRDFPLVAAPGRTVYFSTGVVSEHSRRLSQMREAPYVEINETDAAPRGIGPADQVRLTSSQGALELAAKVTSATRAGQVVVYVNYADNAMSRLASPVTNPGLLKLKAIPVRLERLGGPVASKVNGRRGIVGLPVVAPPSANH